MAKPINLQYVYKKLNFDIMKPTDLQYIYKKQIGFTLSQKKSLQTLKKFGVNINQFIRQAIKEKIQSDWPEIKESKNKNKLPF